MPMLRVIQSVKSDPLYLFELSLMTEAMLCFSNATYLLNSVISGDTIPVILI